MARECGGQADEPAAHDEHVRRAWQPVRYPGFERGAIGVVDGVEPDRVGTHCGVGDGRRDAVRRAVYSARRDSSSVISATMRSSSGSAFSGGFPVRCM